MGGQFKPELGGQFQRNLQMDALLRDYKAKKAYSK
jgi:hypothetical protein